MKKVCRNRRGRVGLTLIELLVTMCLIGFLVMMASASYSTSHAARLAKDQRNAQTMCSVCSTLQVAGHDLVQSAPNKLQVLRALRDGVTLTKGPLQGQTFRVPNLDEDDLAAAAKFLVLENGQLTYNQSGE